MKLRTIAFVICAAFNVLTVQAQGTNTSSPDHPQTTPQTGKPLTLAQAEATALKNNPQITIAKLRASAL